MNNKRRKQLKQAIKMLNDAKIIIENVFSEEDESLSNLPENLQDSEMAETLNENVNDMEEAISNVEDAISYLEEIIK